MAWVRPVISQVDALSSLLFIDQESSEDALLTASSCIAAFLSDYSVGTTPLRSHPDMNVCKL
jgi:hypothetical protein